MAMSNPVQFFGICRAVVYDLETREYLGPPIRVLQSSSFSTDKELLENVGGCQAYPYSTASGRATAEGSLAFNELSPWMYAKLAGGTVTINGAEAGGNVSAMADIVGTSLTDLSTGIVFGAKSGSESSLTFGQYRVVAKTADTVDVYDSSSSDADDMLIAADLDVSATAEIAAYGLEVTLAGATALVVGDVAIFDVRPINEGSSVSVMGASSDTSVDVGLLLYLPTQDGNVKELDIYKVRFSGLPESATSNEFQSIEAAFKASYDSTRDGVYSVRIVNGI